MSNVSAEKIEAIAYEVVKALSETHTVGEASFILAQGILRHHLQDTQPSLSGCDEAFEQWWKAYPKCPRKIRNEKCLGIWQRRWKKDELPGIMAMLITLEAQKRHWQKEDWKYVPLPQTYLNGAQWEDEVADVPCEPTHEEQRERREKEEELYRRLQGLQEGDGEDELNRDTMARLRSEIGLPAF